MSATGPGTFKTDRRKVADEGAPVPMIGCTCAICRETEWVTLSGGQGPGAGSRIFKKKGWALGRRGTSNDLCPKCVGGKRRKRAEKPDNRSPKQRRMAYLIATGVVDKDNPERTGVAMHLSQVPVNSIMADVLAPVKEAIEKRQREEAAKPLPEPRRGNYEASGFARRWNAVRSATTFLKGLDIPNPREDVHFRIVQSEDKTYGYELIDQPELPNEPQPETVEKEETPMPAQPAAEPPRQPLPSDNRRILVAMEEHYDTEKRRYFKNFSDASVAAKLDVPAAWVKAFREQFDYGPDRNENAEAEIKAIREAYVEAQRTSSRLMEMAAEADTLTDNLRQRLAKLGVTV